MWNKYLPEHHFLYVLQTILLRPGRGNTGFCSLWEQTMCHKQQLFLPLASPPPRLPVPRPHLPYPSPYGSSEKVPKEHSPHSQGSPLSRSHKICRSLNPLCKLNLRASLGDTHPQVPTYPSWEANPIFKPNLGTWSHNSCYTWKLTMLQEM